MMKVMVDSSACTLCGFSAESEGLLLVKSGEAYLCGGCHLKLEQDLREYRKAKREGRLINLEDLKAEFELNTED